MDRNGSTDIAMDGVYVCDNWCKYFLSVSQPRLYVECGVVLARNGVSLITVNERAFDREE